MGNIKIDELASAIADELANYSQDVADALKDEIKKAAKEGVTEIKAKSPKRSGKYQRSWGSKKVYEDNGDIRIVIRNAKHYQIIHLLEFGHLGRDGKRVAPKVHVAPVQDDLDKKLLGKIKTRISRGLS